MTDKIIDEIHAIRAEQTKELFALSQDERVAKVNTDAAETIKKSGLKITFLESAKPRLKRC